MLLGWIYFEINAEYWYCIMLVLVWKRTEEVLTQNHKILGSAFVRNMNKIFLLKKPGYEPTTSCVHVMGFTNVWPKYISVIFWKCLSVCTKISVYYASHYVKRSSNKPNPAKNSTCFDKLALCIEYIFRQILNYAKSFSPRYIFNMSCCVCMLLYLNELLTEM